MRVALNELVSMMSAPAARYLQWMSDTMSGLDFSDLDYAHITRIIDDIARSVCEEKIVSVLEGGYEPRSLSRAVLAHIRTLAHL